MGALSNAPREIFNKWEDTGLPTGAHTIGNVGIVAGAAAIGSVSATATLLAATGRNIGDVGITKITAGTISMVSTVNNIANIAAGTISMISKIAADELRVVVVSASVLANTAGTYEAGDLAGTGGLLTFANAARVTGGQGCVRGAVFVERDDYEIDFDLILFNTTTISTTFTDVAAMDIDDIDVDKVIGVITVATADYLDLGGNQVAWKKAQDIYFDLPSGATSLYGAVRTAASWTPTTTSALGIQLQIERF